jgi:hypothetical protein
MRTNNDGQQVLLTIPQAAHRLGVVHIGRCARIPVASVDNFVERIRDRSATKR